MEEIKEEFYNLLEQNMNQIAGSDTKIVLGDYVGLDMYREWKKTEFPKEYYI
jgi:hypothetical protein